MKVVHELIRRHNILRPGQTVIVAVSGGPDSIALLHFLWEERHHYSLEVRACHLNHSLRGKEAEEDAAFVRTFCQERGIYLYENKLDVKAYAQKERIGTQLAARTLRYKWFAQLLETVSAGSVATAHHGDDQVETMMMKMIRGTLPLYSFGIPVERKLERGSVIRPFLALTKAEIESYCQEHDLSYCYDSSNESKKYTRNRLRLELLPILKKENENIHIHLQRQNEWQSEDNHFLMEQAKRHLPSITKKKSDQFVTISRNDFLNVALPLQRRLVHLILSYLCRELPIMTSIHIEQVIELLHRNHPSAQYHVTETVHVRRAYDECHFFIHTHRHEAESEQQLSIRSERSFYDWTIRTDVTDQEVVEREEQIVLDYDEVALPLYVRSRRQDDRMACRGMDGTKKVSRLFIDRKVPRHERERWPLIVDAKGQVLWVPFLHRSRIANVGEHTKRRLVISCSRHEELARLL